MRSDTGSANLHLSTHCLCRQHTSALKLPSLSACHPILSRHQNSALALMAHNREQQLCHSPNWARNWLISPTAALWLWVPQVRWDMPSGLILKEHQSVEVDGSEWKEKKVKTLAFSIYQPYPVNPFPSNAGRFTLFISTFYLLFSVLRFSLNCSPRHDFKIWKTADGTWPE